MMQPGTGMMIPSMTHMPFDHHYMQYPPVSPRPHPHWVMLPPQHPQGSPMWVPPFVLPPYQQPQIHPHPYHPRQKHEQGQGSSASDEIRTLWIGDLQYWMNENYLWNCFVQTGEVVSVKIIRNRHTGQSDGYGFIEFITREAAENVLQSFNSNLMPSTDQNFRLNWATFGSGERRVDGFSDHTLFVGDLAADVTDFTLLKLFKSSYLSVKGAKVVTDRITGRSKGYGFVRFGSEYDHERAMIEMNGKSFFNRAMRVGRATSKFLPGGNKQTQMASPQQTQQGEADPNNTTIFVGGLDPSVSDEQLRELFCQYGELVHVKIPVGKRCGFVQFSSRVSAEKALSSLNGTQLGGQSIRLSWGRTAMSKQAQFDQNQWNGGFYGYPHGYGYIATPVHDPTMYYSSYPGYYRQLQP